MPNSNKILLFSDYLFFTKLVELPISIKNKDIAFFVENELESSSPIGIDFLKWSYLRKGKSLLIFASTSDRLAQAGYTHEEIDNATYAVPEAALLAKLEFADGWNIITMPKTLNAIYVENGTWKIFNSVELGSGDIEEQSASFARQNGAENFNFYTFENYSLGSFSTIKVSLNGENCDSIKSSFKSSSVLSDLDIRDDSLLKELKAKAFKTNLTLCMITAVPVLAILLGLMQYSIMNKKEELTALGEKLAILEPMAKKLQDLNKQIDSARNFAQSPLFNALLLAKIDNSRPDGVRFTKTLAKSATEMNIQGEATNLSLLNEYVNFLKREDFVEDIDLESSSKSGEAKFKIKLTFKEQSNV